MAVTFGRLSCFVRLSRTVIVLTGRGISSDAAVCWKLSGHCPHAFRLAAPGSLLVQSLRHLAASKKGKQKKIAKQLPEIEIDSERLQNLESLLGKEIHHLRHAFSTYLSLRLTASSFESMIVKLPEGSFPLSHLAKISMKSPRLFVINMSANPTAVKPAILAFYKSGLDVIPQQQQGSILSLPVPEITREYREKLSKNAKRLLNDTNDRIRELCGKEQQFLQIPANLQGQTTDTILRARKTVEDLQKKYMAIGEQVMKEKQDELMEEVK